MPGLAPRAALLLVCLLPSVAAAQDRTLSPFFQIDGGDPGIDRLPLLGTDVTVNISGVIAEVTVRQRYRNDGTRPIHARYVFPASTRAAVHGLSLVVGRDVIRARIRERTRARQEFEAARRDGRNAALLEQQRPNVFTMEVANVVPGQQIDVELRYTELLAPAGGTYEFVYPTVVGPRYPNVSPGDDHDRWLRTPYTHASRPPAATFALAGTLSAGLAVESLESPSHAVLSESIDPSTIRFALDPGEAQGGDRDLVLRYRLAGAALSSGMLLYEGQGENFFLAMIQPPARVIPAEIPPREYILVVDVSGSMRGFPLEVSKELLRDLIGNLRATDTFNIAFFAGGSRIWSPRSLPATAANVSRAMMALDEEEGGGGTELLPALRRVMDLPHEPGVSRSLLVVTDGYIAAETELFSFIRGHLDEANVFAFGIGSSVNRHLIEGIARAGLGEPFVSIDATGARASAARFRSYVAAPVLTGVTVRVEGFDVHDVEPTTFPDVLADRPILVQGKYRGEARGRVIVSGVTGAGSYQEALDVSSFRPEASNRALRQLWARTRIADLSDLRSGPETEAERSQLVALGIQYQLLTRHTSFVAVHEVVREDAGVAEWVEQPLPLPAGVSDAAVGGMEMGDEPRPPLLLVLLLACAIVAWRARWRRVRA